MKRVILAGMLLIPTVLNAQTVVHPDSPKTITLSNTDINRIVCKDGLINDVIYSEEKGMTVVNKAGNAFIKYLVKSTPDGNRYITSSTEIHVVCDDKTYTIIAQPSEVNARTVVLSGGVVSRVKENISKYAGLDHEERLLALTRQVYRNEIDENLLVKHVGESVQVYPKGFDRAGFFKNISFVKAREIIMEGVNLKATEYQITAKSPMQFNETDFLQHDLGHSIAGVTLSKKSLDAGESARLIIVTNEAL
jgi:conjugal transfer pilus assembly protein TraK